MAELNQEAWDRYERHLGEATKYLAGGRCEVCTEKPFVFSKVVELLGVCWSLFDALECGRAGATVQVIPLLPANPARPRFSESRSTEFNLTLASGKMMRCRSKSFSKNKKWRESFEHVQIPVTVVTAQFAENQMVEVVRQRLIRVTTRCAGSCECMEPSETQTVDTDAVDDNNARLRARITELEVELASIRNNDGGSQSETVAK